MRRQSAIWVSAVVALSRASVEAQNPPSSDGGASPQLEEIVITAHKRTERLADVPVSASVVSPNALLRDNAGDISDLNNIVPSVDLVGTFNGRMPMGIRGISSNANESTVGLASGVTIMVDGVPIPSDSQSGNQLEDIKSVEVRKNHIMACYKTI
jgi:iron complex outermembrane receptor protein